MCRKRIISAAAETGHNMPRSQAPRARLPSICPSGTEEPVFFNPAMAGMVCSCFCSFCGLLLSSSMPRKIVHLDMDCFYAAIEVRDHPELAGKPVAVGGARDRRGVLTTCNYEAREFGVRSAMPTFQALQKCPHLIVMPTRFDVYRRESAKIRDILMKFSPVIEPLSLDEAFLDLSDHPGETSATVTVIRQLI